MISLPWSQMQANILTVSGVMRSPRALAGVTLLVAPAARASLMISRSLPDSSRCSGEVWTCGWPGASAIKTQTGAKPLWRWRLLGRQARFNLNEQRDQEPPLLELPRRFVSPPANHPSRPYTRSLFSRPI